MAFAAQYPQLPTPLVDKEGYVTPPWHYFFQSLWNRTGGGSGSGSTILDGISNVPGGMLFRGPAEWAALPVGTNGDLLTVVSGFPAWSTISAALDTLGSQVGELLARTASGWTILPAGEAGTVLSSIGPGNELRYLPVGAVLTLIVPSAFVAQALATVPTIINITFAPPRVVTAVGPAATTADDYIVVINQTVGAAITVNLYATPADGSQIIIKDGKGDAAANNITITPAAGNIDGAGTKVINTNYGFFSLVYNGTDSQWNVI